MQTGWGRSLVAMLDMGMPMRDPLVSGILNAIRECMLLGLRTKARILAHQAARLMGVMDETNTLEYGQVFVQVRRNCPTDTSDPSSYYNPEVALKSRSTFTVCTVQSIASEYKRLEELPEERIPTPKCPVGCRTVGEGAFGYVSEDLMILSTFS
eukprot:scaffold681480_cov106-Prasinocladus_malaysianus.AAC.1